MSTKSKRSMSPRGSRNGTAESAAAARVDATSEDGDDDGQLPLLDEVSNLLQKERTLMGLRVLEKEAEAIDWRTKYETLVSKLSDGSAEGTTPLGDAARGLEIAAELDSASSAPTIIPDFRARVMQTLREDKESMLDLSNTNVGIHGISEVLKILRATKKTTYLRSICLKNANLDPSCSEQAAALFGFPFLEALDLSYNSLGRNFLSSLITTLQMRRRSPQYIMLNCNPELSDQSLAPILPNLSRDTWGLVISADDGPSGALGAQQISSFKSKAPAHQRCAYEFLRILNARMASLKQHEVFEGTEEPKRKSKSGNKEEAVGPGVRRGGVSSLSVLGIVHSTISKLSLRLLEETLELTEASLTDLDLSFCMIGYRGVDMLQRALCKPSSQVIRLGLRGNCITDAAVPLLGKIIESSQTLIHIDLGANVITGEGLAQLTKHIKKNVILFSIRLCGNPMGVHSVAASQEAIEKGGGLVKLIFTDAIAASSPRPMGLSSYRDGALYYSAKIITTTLQPEPKVIFKIPVKSIQIKEAIRFDAGDNDDNEVMASEAPQRPDHIGSLLLRWKMKVRTSEALAAMERDPFSFKATDTNIFAPIEWEVLHCSAHNKRTIYCSTDAGRPSFVPGNEQWSICEAVIAQVPLVGHIEIVIRRISSAENYKADEEDSQKPIRGKTMASSVGKAIVTAPSIYVDAYDLCVSVHDNPLHPTLGSAGSDMSAWNGFTNQAVSATASVIATLPSSHVMDNMKQSILYTSHSDYARSSGQTRKSDGFPLPDHTIIRILSWPGPIVNDAKLSFSMKLTNVVSGASTYEGGGVGRVKSAHFGYEWAVTVYRVHGVLERPVRASILPQSETLIPQDSSQQVAFEDAGTHTSSLSLAPWSWRAWAVTLNMALRPGDRVFLTARVLAEGAPHSVPSSIAVVCQDVSFNFLRTTANGDWLVPGTEESALFAVHNDPGLLISL